MKSKSVSSILFVLFTGILQTGCRQSAPTAAQIVDTPDPQLSLSLAPPAPTGFPAPTNMPSFVTAEGFDFTREGLALESGGGSGWDKNQVFQPDVIYHDGVFHMFYVGSRSSIDDTSIGYATSSDGLNFTKHPDNPILAGTDEYPSLYAPEVVFDGQQWVLYVNASDTGVPIGDAILRATASDLGGPWELSTTSVLSGGGLRPWDRRMQPATVLSVDDGLLMYYFATGSPGFQMGSATSPDGINWTRYNDPDTGDRYEQSDPILTVGPAESFDSYTAATLEVVWNPDQQRWEMFYTGAMTDPFTVTRQSILTKKPATLGYAVSDDGIHWSKHPENPVITILENCWLLLGTVLLDNTYYIYYDQNCGFEGIAVLRGTIAE